MKEEKALFFPGDLVTFKHDLPNKPEKMLITKIIKNKNTFEGVQCEWFTPGEIRQEAIFSTKDLVKL